MRAASLGSGSRGNGTLIEDGDVASIAADIERRDTVDTQRSASPLMEAEDAIVVDTSEMTLEQVVDHVIELIP